jgi:hypothetical protein
MKREICIHVAVDDQRDWNGVRRFLKGVLRNYGVKCVGLSEPPISGVVENEYAQAYLSSGVVENKSTEAALVDSKSNRQNCPFTVTSDTSTCSNLTTCETSQNCRVMEATK